MLNIILLIITGSVFVYIAGDNLTPVTLNLAQYMLEGVPLFYVIMGSLLLGLVLSYILQLLRAIGNSYVLRGKERVINSAHSEVVNLTKRIHQLELENEKLKHQQPIIQDEHSL